MTNSADLDHKPTDLDLHCLLRQGMSCSAREGLIGGSKISYGVAGKGIRLDQITLLFQCFNCKKKTKQKKNKKKKKKKKNCTVLCV